MGTISIRQQPDFQILLHAFRLVTCGHVAVFAITLGTPEKHFNRVKKPLRSVEKRNRSDSARFCNSLAILVANCLLVHVRVDDSLRKVVHIRHVLRELGVPLNFAHVLVVVLKATENVGHVRWFGNRPKIRTQDFVAFQGGFNALFGIVFVRLADGMFARFVVPAQSGPQTYIARPKRLPILVDEPTPGFALLQALILALFAVDQCLQRKKNRNPFVNNDERKSDYFAKQLEVDQSHFYYCMMVGTYATKCNQSNQ